MLKDTEILYSVCVAAMFLLNLWPVMAGLCSFFTSAEIPPARSACCGLVTPLQVLSSKDRAVMRHLLALL